MTDRPPDHPSFQGSDGPTRDIRLPPLPPPPYHAPDDEPTDRLQPPGGPVRQGTVAFDAPAIPPPHGPPPVGAPVTGPAAQNPAPPAAPVGRPGGDARKWPWVLLVLLPLVVIVAAGLVLALLLGSG